MTDVLLDYIKTCRDAGLSDIEIGKRLLQVGWPKTDVGKSLGINVDIEIPPPPAPPLSSLQSEGAGVLVKVKNRFGFLKWPFKRKAKNITPIPKQQGRGRKIWRAFENAQKLMLIILILAGVGYGGYLLLNLKQNEIEFDRNMDQQRMDNFSALKDKLIKTYASTHKLPDKISNIDSAGTISKDPGTGQTYDYQKITVMSFQFCTVFNLDGQSYKKGYTCFPYELNTLGQATAGLPYNPVQDNTAAVLSSNQQQFPGCDNPQPLLANNQRCVDPQNCRRPMFVQEFGMSSVDLSNSKDRIAQTFKLPKDLKTGELTEVSPWFITYSGTSACMAIYQLSDEADPLSGTELAEYKIDIPSLKKEAYNPLYIKPIKLEAGKIYSMVFSLPDDNSFLTFARGMENSDYYDGTAYYLKQPLLACTKNCEPVQWVDRQDDIKFGIKFY
jgi:hypothetical protein